MTADATPVHPEETPAPFPRLDRAAIEALVRAGQRLLVQGGMGIHASDGLAGKVARHRGARLVGVGTISAVLKTPEQLRGEIRRARAEAPGGFVGVNLMAAINKDDFEALARVSIEEKVSFLVQGAGISREIVRWCREGGVPFCGIVSSGRLAAMYEKWGADFVVAEGAEAGGHIGDIGHPLPTLVDEVIAATSLPVIAAGGVDAADVSRFLAAGAAGVQMATRFLACSDGDVHPAFKQMHLAKREDDVVIITSCVKGMKARAVRNAFTERLARGEAVPPRSKLWWFGKDGYRGRRGSCIQCLGEGLCKARASGFKESFCITDALLEAAVHGDTEAGLFYTGQSITRIGERDASDLPRAAEILTDLEQRLADEARPSDAGSQARPAAVGAAA
ncbi:2-nitropropane dioxygenase NPD [Anaeromyxobacter dehalogenans 2CP-1]|uniref:2-nitropropane dioxygenase NPD n=1 Tax=Anaeromyxobacter dehalogenans (strain ATCC BAA-258 / DSM 21875 / 2CP-1) TaxID=455488 RepID=B8J9T0_ANAD2|nr:nitronate monooxygenase [Anaeromyxobacter dehalogenans]ACL63633.1 2-nitropropane dioxygenase NPD [Anaeromyxobacter dehalogenans 2CP-1]